MTIDVDATLVTVHSEKERAAGNYKGGYGFHPLQAYSDETREALGGMLRPGNAGANTAADHITVLDRALEQIPGEYVEQFEILVRADSAGATHGLTDYCREAKMRFSIGYELTEAVRAAIPKLPTDPMQLGRLLLCVHRDCSCLISVGVLWRLRGDGQRCLRGLLVSRSCRRAHRACRRRHGSARAGR